MQARREPNDSAVVDGLQETTMMEEQRVSVQSPDASQAAEESQRLVDPVLEENLSSDERRSAFYRLERALSDQDANIREYVAEALLRRMTFALSPEMEGAFCDCLEACGSDIAVSTAVRTLRMIAAGQLENDAVVSLDLAVLLFHRVTTKRVNEQEDVFAWCQTCGIAGVLDTLSESGDKQKQHFLLRQTRLDRWVSLLMVLPSLIANACHQTSVPFPSWAAQGRFYSRLVDIAMELVLVSKTLDADNEGGGDVYSPTTIQYLHLVVQHMLRRQRGGEEVALGLHKAYERNPSQKVCSGELTVSLLRSLVPRESAVLCRAMLRHILSRTTPRLDVPTANETPNRMSHPLLDASVRRVLVLDPDRAAAFVRLAVLSTSSVLSAAAFDWQFCHAVASLLACVEIQNRGGDDGSESDSDSSYESDDEKNPVESDKASVDYLLRRYLVQVAESWSKPSFVRHADGPMQRHVTHFLRSGLQLLSEGPEDAASSLVAALLEGVVERLSSTILDIRKDGMHVAKLLANRLGEEIEFEEIQDEKEPPVALEVADTKTCLGNRRSEKKARSLKQQHLDPDRDYVSDDGSDVQNDNNRESAGDSDSVWEDDSAIEPYDLHDDEEDLRETAKPLYLADCLDLLRARETEEHAASRHETALQELPKLVKAGPIDLPDIAQELVLEILHFENKFDIDNFLELVSQSLCSLAVAEPSSVGQVLIKRMYQDVSLATRLNILDTLSAAARKLSGYIERQESKMVRNPEIT